MKLDQIDLQILRLLQENSKITNLELSKQINLSPAPTLGRVLKLEKAGIIDSYKAQLNRSKLGLNFMALIQVSLTRQISNAMNNFVNQIQEIEEIVECLQLTGNFDYQLKIIAKDIPEFDRIMNEKLSNIEEIRQMQTMVVLSSIKSSTLLPLDYNS